MNQKLKIGLKIICINNNFANLAFIILICMYSCKPKSYLMDYHPIGGITVYKEDSLKFILYGESNIYNAKNSSELNFNIDCKIVNLSHNTFIFNQKSIQLSTNLYNYELSKILCQPVNSLYYNDSCMEQNSILIKKNEAIKVIFAYTSKLKQKIPLETLSKQISKETIKISGFELINKNTNKPVKIPGIELIPIKESLIKRY